MLPAAAVLLVVLLLTWLSFGAVNTEAELFDRALGALDELAMTEQTLQRDVLTARAGMLRNYDPLVREMQVLDNTFARLRRSAPDDPATAAAIDGLAASISHQEDLIEQFKSNNALLQNSLAYFALFSSNLESPGRSEPLGPVVGPLAAAMLRLSLDASSANAREVEDRLDELARRPRSPDDADLTQALLAHGRLLHDLLPATDGILKALSAVPQRRNQEEVRTGVLAQQAASRVTARRFRLMLYATSLLLLGLLVYLALQLRKWARALRRRAAFEHVIASVSMRFINAQPQKTGALIEQALADMAECVGADRAYFLLAGPSNRMHTWSGPGMTFPPGWPTQAPALMAGTQLTAEGIVHVPSVNCLPHGEERDAYAAFGLAGWACVSNIDGKGVSGLLGFDALQGSCYITPPGELSLLRMALDTINNAIEREFFERERARLQQARRMETIGAFASGIAHNFNNIIGAILGYTEIVEAQIEPDSRPGRNLGEIRRSGERARDLVDQILTFGRRGNLRRTHLNLNALVAEAKSLLHASLPSRIELVASEAAETVIISGELAQLQQVILNLCNNAAQAIDATGRVEIETQALQIGQPLSLTHGELAPGRYAKISVRDGGRGMDDATIERIFEPFFTTRPDGHGLGLATVREIVREHGGALDVWSTVGLGSRFEVWLPCITVTDLMPNDDPPSLPLGHGETVLLVTDEHGRLLKDEETLAALGYEPVGFTRPDDALGACRTTLARFDAIVIGHAPAARALDLAAALNRLAPYLPIVLAMASAEDFDTSSLTAAGVFERVRYPLSSAELAGALARCLAVPVTQPRYADNAMSAHG
ncbi:MAG: integral rane sensor hybrid histidine kinase [Rhodospirillales bacterium]|nr:integral rane sensor hybrid histidine kinase [Rhodospirillales bacterium]